MLIVCFEELHMADTPAYEPPKVWTWDKESGGKFANINRPIAGPTHDKELQVGKHPMQLYSLATPNGVKATVMLEELLALGHEGAEYDAWLININDGDQFGSGFVDINPNSKIPALCDHSTTPPTRVFESGAILVYLAEKFGELLPTEPSQRAECMSWLFWQMSSAAYLGGGFGHFTPTPRRSGSTPSISTRWKLSDSWMYWIRNLSGRRYLCGDEYTIADIATVAWVRRAGGGQNSTTPPNSSTWRPTNTSIAGTTRSWNVPPCSAAGASTACGATRTSRSGNGTMRATSRNKRPDSP